MNKDVYSFTNSDSKADHIRSLASECRQSHLSAQEGMFGQVYIQLLADIEAAVRRANGLKETFNVSEVVRHYYGRHGSDQWLDWDDALPYLAYRLELDGFRVSHNQVKRTLEASW